MAGERFVRHAMATTVEPHTATYHLKLALPLALFFLVFFLAPLAILFYVSLHTDPSMTTMGLTQYIKFLTDPFSLTVLVHTLWIGVQVTALCQMNH